MISFLKKISNFENFSVNIVRWVGVVTVLVLVKMVLVAIATSDVRLLSGDLIGLPFLRQWSFYIALLLGELLLLVALTKDQFERVSAFLLVALATSFIPYVIGIFYPLAVASDSLVVSPVIYSLRDIGIYFLEHCRAMGMDVRLELIIAIIFLAGFVFMKTRSVIKSFLGILFFVPGVFLLQFLPYITAWITNSSVFRSYGDISYLNSNFSGTNAVYSLFSALVIVIEMTAAYFLYNRLKFFAALHNVIRFPRLVVNLVVLSLGLILALTEIPLVQLTLIDSLLIFSAYASLLFYWSWAVHDNDLHDQNGDAIAMKQRPLQQGITTQEEVRDLNFVFLLVSLILAFIVGYGFLLFMLLRIGIGYLYSSEPFRLKRFAIASNITLAAAYLSTMLAGYMIIADHTILTFSPRLAILVFLFYVLSSELKSIVSYEGDKADGITTMPTLFGLERGKKIVAAMGFAAFLLVPIIYSNFFMILIVPALLAGGWYSWTLTRGRYEETELYVIHVAFALYLIVLYSLHLITF